MKAADDQDPRNRLVNRPAVARACKREAWRIAMTRSVAHPPSFCFGLCSAHFRRKYSEQSVIVGEPYLPLQSLPGRTSSNSGHDRIAPTAVESSLPVICLCGLMARHMTSSPRSSLLKGWQGACQEI
jgi:hypothetical protein